MSLYRPDAQTDLEPDARTDNIENNNHVKPNAFELVGVAA
jgi:hypothetical protein